jgi:DNA-3-methyladenine glycosylase II
MPSFTIQPRGPFSLAAAERFFGGWEATAGAQPSDGGLRVGFRVDDWGGAAGLLVRQEAPDRPVEATVLVTEGTVDAARVERQIARVLSLDHDGTGYAAVGERDPVVGRLQRESGYLRPVLFNSPYEAAGWAIISARLHHRQARRVRSEMSSRLVVDGVALEVFPAPEELLARDAIPGLSAEKVTRLHGVARAALEGRLESERLLALPVEEAIAEVQRLRGIGPFWATLIVLRAVGPTDAFTGGEPRGRAAAAAAYGRPELAEDDAAYAALADTWRPFRTWVSVLIRATASS